MYSTSSTVNILQDIAVGNVDGAFKTISDRSRPEIDVDGYRRLATSSKYLTPAHNSYEELEELYWKQNLDDKAMPPIYGADVCDTLTDEDQKAWNIKRLDSLLTEVMEEQIPGVNLPYLYFGMWKATFSWHVEDMDLYSVNCELPPKTDAASDFLSQISIGVHLRPGTVYRPSMAINWSRFLLQFCHWFLIEVARLPKSFSPTLPHPASTY